MCRALWVQVPPKAILKMTALGFVLCCVALSLGSLAGFYLEIIFWGGNMVDKDGKKGHNTLLCTVGAFATSQL